MPLRTKLFTAILTSFFWQASFALMVVSASTISLAQDQKPIMLEEVIVTAQKRTQNLQDVPVAVSVVDGDKLADAGIQDLQELGAYVPNFTQTSTTIANLIFIRGIGSGDNVSFEQSVGIFHDGIFWGRGRQSLSPLYDLDRIEVLKGPQGVLFGKNTVAGAVSSTSARPSDEFSGSFTVSGGSFDEQKLESAIGGPISDTIRARLALHYQDSDGWTKNAFTRQDEPSKKTTGARLGFSFDAGDTLMGYIKLEWNGFDLIGQPYELIKSTPVSLSIPMLGVDNATIPPHIQGIESRFDRHGNFGNTSIPSRKGAEYHIEMANHMIHLEWAMGENTLTSVSGYSSYRFKGIGDLDFSPVDIIGVNNTEDYRQFSQELRIQSPLGGTFDYITGLYLQTSELDLFADGSFRISNLLTPILPIPSLIDLVQQREGSRITNYDLDSDSASVFFQGTFNINDYLRFTLGGRYTYETKKVDKTVSIETINAGSISASDANAALDGSYVDTGTRTATDINSILDELWVPFIDVYPYEFKDERKEKQFTPQITLEWDADESSMIYVSTTKGFKGGGFDVTHANGLEMDKLEYEEERAIAYEIGAKMVLWDNRLNLNTALYRTEFEDLQVSIYNGTNGWNVGNAAEATSQGLEIEGRFMATANLEVNASIAWNDFSYDSYENGQCTTADQADYLEEYGNISDCTTPLTGEKAMLSADKIASLSFMHFMPLSDRLQLISTLDFNYSDDYFLSPDLDPVTRQSSFTKVNARLSLVDDSGWQLALLVKNLTNEKTRSSSEDVPFGNGNFYGEVICSYVSPICEDTIAQVADREGSYYGVTESPRRYILEARYRF